MLTNHRIDGEGNKAPRYEEGKSCDLLSYIGKCNNKDLGHWEHWLKPHVSNYRTLHPVNEVFFNDNNRHNYWELCERPIKEKNALIFIDPDTGLETGKPSYLRKMGREKYILNYELDLICEKVDESSILMIYQHLPKDKNIHQESVLKKINQVISSTNCQYVMAYREDDLAFIFVMKNRLIYSTLNRLLTKYHGKSGHKYKSIHYAPNKANSADAKSRG